MKKPLFFALAMCRCIYSYAQSPIPLDSFYTPGSSWTEVATTTYAPCSAGDEINVSGILYKIEKDTIVSGKTYHVVSSCNIGGYGNNVDCNSGANTNYADSGFCTYPQQSIGMIRTDSGRVYFTLLVSQTGNAFNYDCDTVGKEELFYDFNAGTGSVDSVSLSNGVKVPRYDGYIVFGIGAPDGFIDYWSLYVCGPGPSANQFLLCYNNPHFSYQFSYPAGTLPGSLQYDCFDMAQYIDSINSITNTANNGLSGFNIYPNPATDWLNILDTVAITSISITNSAGQLIYKVQYDPIYYYYTELVIDVSAFPAGMYFIRVNGNKASKFVKQIPHR